MLKDLVLKNRSYRKFDESKPISRTLLLQLIDTSRFTPSSVNIQPIKYYLSCNPHTNSQIRSHTHWAKMLENYDGPQIGENPTAYIIVCIDKKIAPNIERFDKDIGIVSQTIMLQAVELGLGGCMIGNYDSSDISSVFDMPDSISPRLILALGIPNESISLEPVADSVRYYRDSNNVHHVPKRALDEIVLN